MIDSFEPSRPRVNLYYSKRNGHSKRFARTIADIKSGRRKPLFGGALQKMETSFEFAIGLISSPRWEQDTEQQRRPSNDRVPGNKTER
jgi:hypothetical protein